MWESTWSPRGVIEVDRVLAHLGSSRGVTVDECAANSFSISPLRRNAEAHDVASAVLFLLSDAARSITGEDLNVSSGAVTY